MEKSVFRYKVGPQYVDFTSRVSVSSMCDLVLHAAGEDAHKRGFGIDALAGNNYGWVLSRMCLEMDYLPEEYSEFTLYTWISDYNRLSSTRNFTLVNDKGEEFGRAVSQWCMIDYATRMPVDMNTMAKAHEGNMVDSPSPCERPRRIGVVTSEPVKEHRVVYSDIDFNRHMNTMRYIDMIFDTLPIEVPEHLSAFRFDMNFMKESRYGDYLTLMAQSEGNTYQFAYRNDSGEALCRMALEVR
ncbi:MAG: acyl-ACP thioesterase [Alistipes sp.]|nr:acyl-ACP thioesterase [Alistipes sp.]